MSLKNRYKTKNGRIYDAPSILVEAVKHHCENSIGGKPVSRSMILKVIYNRGQNRAISRRVADAVTHVRKTLGIPRSQRASV